RAHERLALTARRGLDARAAVAAHVEVDGHAALVGAHGQERRAGRVVREEVAGRGELRGVPDRQRQLAEQPDALALVLPLAGVRRHRDRRRRGRGVRRPPLEVGEHAADEHGLYVWLHGGLLRKGPPDHRPRAFPTPKKPKAPTERAPSRVISEWQSDHWFSSGLGCHWPAWMFARVLS